MKRDAVSDRVQHETKAAQGEDSKDKVYSSEQTFADEVTARNAFAESILKLLNVNGWSGLSHFTADFALYDSFGRPKPDGLVQIGDYIKIALPGPMPENWVRVKRLVMQENEVAFTVQPCPDPEENKPGEIAHFFDQTARSTFRVERAGLTIRAYEIGEHEVINNHDSQAGDRAIINTVIAEAGWLFHQKIQWKLLTDYLVHL